MPLKVFISYTRKDSALARRVARKLEELGAEALFDISHLKHGNSIPRTVQEALRTSDLLIAIVSKESAHSPNLNWELGAGVGLGKRVAIIVDDIQPNELPPTLRSLHLVEARQINGELPRLLKYAAPEKVAG